LKSNLVYLMENITKKGNPKYYIGSKQEASIEEFNGVMTVLDRYDKPYYSSSSSYLMAEDMKNGDVFVSSLLESRIKRKDLITVENKHMEIVGSLHSDEYYNLSNATLDCHNKDAVVNRFGERGKELASRNSSLAKRDNKARKLGFENFGYFHLWIREKVDEGLNHAEMCKIIGKYRSYTRASIKGINLEKALMEIEDKDKYQEDLRNLVYEGCSFYHACTILDLELTSGRIILGDFNKSGERAYRAASKKSMSKEELEIRIVTIILDSKDGQGFQRAARELNINRSTVGRYLSRYIKKYLPRPANP